MDSPTVINVVTVIVSIAALYLSTGVARNQFKAQRHGNHIDPLISLLTEFRSLEFHQNYAYIRDELPKFSSEGGISGLSEDVQQRIYSIGYFFQLYAILVYLDIIDVRFISALLHRRYVEMWAALRPFVHKERELKNLPPASILNIFESFAGLMTDCPPNEMDKIIHSWNMRKASIVRKTPY